MPNDASPGDWDGVTLEALEAERLRAHGCLDEAATACVKIREANRFLDQGATSDVFERHTLRLWSNLERRCKPCRSSAAVDFIRRANANDLKPIPIPVPHPADEPPLTAHDAARELALEMEGVCDMTQFESWDAGEDPQPPTGDEREEGRREPYPEARRILDCRRVAGQVARITGAFIREIRERIDVESIRAQRWLIDQRGAAASGAGMAKKAPGGAITVEEANQAAMRLAKKDPSFVNGGAREWAKRIREASGKTCSTSTVHATALWKKTMEARGRGRRKGGKAKAVSFTDSLEAVTGKGDPREVLNRLTAEQGADSEPSPLDPDPPGKPRRVRWRKRP